MVGFAVLALPEVALGHTPAQVQRIIRVEVRRAGLSAADVDAALWLARRESTYRDRAHSASECHGVFQLSKGMAHGYPWYDPTWNARRAIRYVKGRYGSFTRAKAFWTAHHWY